MSANANLHKAKNAKNDEFYTQITTSQTSNKVAQESQLPQPTANALEVGACKSSN